MLPCNLPRFLTFPDALPFRQSPRTRRRRRLPGRRRCIAGPRSRGLFQFRSPQALNFMSAQVNREFNIFLDPAEVKSLNSMEGIPDCEPAVIEALPGKRLLQTS